MTRPVEPRRLIARINACLRRKRPPGDQVVRPGRPEAGDTRRSNGWVLWGISK